MAVRTRILIRLRSGMSFSSRAVASPAVGGQAGPDQLLIPAVGESWTRINADTYGRGPDVSAMLRSPLMNEVGSGG
jgi:hypothetical protein